ncbi:NAD(+) salvage pathway protein [Scheffersomyces xylosifermentans]|uniref:NAD(+) salvage pathway protein n=1 Tax=Scheffersomyces xylosifermentans TaxID=1304137 RepID=UPI00315D91E6
MVQSKIALAIIDVQEDFLPSHGSLAIKDGRDIIPLINNLITTRKFKWGAIIATQDWHPKNHTSFASQHNVPPFTELEFTHPLGEKDPATGEVKTQKQVVWPDHCVQDSSGACLDASFLGNFNSISPNIPKTVVKKGYLCDREYYSCFQDTWGIHHTEMEDFLRENGITGVVFVGLAYDYCVLNSARDCAKDGFNTYVLKDYCKSVYPDKIAETEDLYKEAGVKIIEDDLLKELLK